VALAAPGAPGPFDPDRPARLHPQVALREESFGALAYHYGNRRLTFVKSAALVEVLRDLDRHATARDAVAAHVGADEVDAHLAALGRLAGTGVVDGG